MAADNGVLEFRLLGPLEATRDGQPLALGGLRQRALLAVLLLNANRVVSTDRLIDELWGDSPPSNPRHTIQVFVSRLRKVLGRDTIVSRGPGYMVEIDDRQLDLLRFEQIVSEARAAQPESAARLLGEALSLFRGQALADFAYEPFAREQAERTEETRLAALERRIEVDLGLGRHAELVGELEQLVLQHPLRERLRAHLVLALYRSGRQADALAAHQDARRVLTEELGLDPGPELQALERQILTHDESLRLEPVEDASGLPSGTVTLLFADVEGSTRLLLEHGERYEALLEDFRGVIRTCVGEHGGIEVDSQGDALFAAFRGANEALAAADAIQRRLSATPLRARIGIHTGEPRLAVEGYVGIDVHRAARIMSAGHGGQILVSQATRDLAAGHDVRDLGTHRLKDMTEPERLYQLGYDDFPPPNTLDATNLPTAPSPLLGRKREVDDIVVLLRDHKLVTLTGPGGTGKTRLAMQVGAELIGAFADGVFWVSLAGVRDPELVLPAIAQTVGASDELAAHLRERDTLILLDNFEHLLPAARDVGRLFALAPRAKLLATSRAPLRLAGEYEYPLDPLAPAEAAMLFIERARAAGRKFEAGETVAEICKRLDHLPLAIELAAARTRLLDPPVLLTKLHSSLAVLTQGSADAPERQRTLRATIQWSHDLLGDQARVLFARLSVFAGSFSLAAAERVCEGDLDTIGVLVDFGLLRSHSGSRFVMLETIREFAAERLDEIGEQKATAIRAAHAGHYLAIVREADERLTGPDQDTWLRRLAVEQDNLRAALTWAVETGGAELALELVAAAGWFWYVRGQLTEGAHWLETALSSDAGSPAIRATALMRAGAIADGLGEYRRAEQHYREALRLRQDAGDLAGTVGALGNLGALAISQADYEAAWEWFEQSLDLARRQGDDLGIAMALGNMGIVAVSSGEPARAVPLLEESAELHERIGHRYALAIVRQALGSAMLGLGDLDGAETHLAGSLQLAHELEEPLGVVASLEELAAVSAARERGEHAARHLGAATAIRESIGATINSTDLVRRERAESAAREQIGTDQFREAYSIGLASDVEEAVAFALGDARGE